MLRNLSSAARSVCQTLNHAGFEAYVVGGAVRDLVRGVTPDDYDLATSATPDQVRGLFRRVIPTGIDHGTVTVLVGKNGLEVTTFRSESNYSDGRHPDAVDYGVSIHEDLSRRDFTINGMALDPIGEEFLDPYGGNDDLTAGLIRAIGEAGQRFAEDALRLLRAVRFAAQLGFTIEPDTWYAIASQAPSIVRISAERVRDEISKILLSETPSVGFRLMRDSGLLDATLPELAIGVGVQQRGDHLFDVFEHSILTCDRTPPDDLGIRLAGLLHDIGKPEALVVDQDGNRTFHGHDSDSARQAETILKRLKFPNATISRVSHLVRHHMFSYTSEWTDAAVRRFLARVGQENVPALFALRAADGYAQRGIETDPRPLQQFGERISAVIANGDALNRKDLAVNGHDLATIGIPRGKAMGTIIEHLFETVLDDPAQNSRENLLTIAQNFYLTRIQTDSGQGTSGR